MKKVLCLVLVLLCLPVWSSAAALTPEEVTQTLNNIINDSTVDNMEQLFVYVEADNATNFETSCCLFLSLNCLFG